MTRLSAVCGLAAVLAGSVPPAMGQARTSHLVRLVADSAERSYRFEPATVSARPNDVVIFRVESGSAHSVVFEGSGLAPQVRAALNRALPGRVGDLRGPLLIGEGTEYRVIVPAIPKGNYAFFCLPHRAYDMRGELKVR